MLRRHVLPLALAPFANAQSRHDRITAYIDSQIQGGPFAGIHGLIHHQGQTVYDHHAGELQSNSIYRIHSMTKPIASAALMALYEEGKFLLDEPVSKYIPGFANTRVLSVEDDPKSATIPLARPITIQHVLTHTSGLNNAKAYVEAKPFAATLEQMAKSLPEIPLSHQPGEGWRYGQSINVVGHLVEIFSGRPLDVFLKERFFAPLQMTDTDFHVPQAKISRLATTYTLDASNKLVAQKLPEPIKNPSFLAGSGGLFSTAKDYLLFCRMLLNGGAIGGPRILSKNTIDFMFRNHVPMNLFPTGGPNGRTGYGFGIGGAILQDAAQSATLSVDGEYTWGGAAGTYFWIDRKSQLIGIWLVQRPPFTQPPSKRFKVLTYQSI